MAAALLQLALPLGGIVPFSHTGKSAVSAVSTPAAASAAAPRPSAPPQSTARSSTPSKAGWHWPLDPRPRLIRKFDPPAKPWLAGHRGIDLAAAPGTPILAPANGTVVFSGWVVDRTVVTIEHTPGLRSSFEPVDSPLPEGTTVVIGQPVGILAVSSHCPPAGCLHWGVRRGQVYLDPLQFILDRRPSVLLPLHPP
ncbi:peptidoglycan DD-metalloendopeptidase family protein [Paeniglutamicibacter antarcticus]|uniref:Peptidoglycan DD-metalloendopeptidase family protein n=2 Tax=Arthrobacter terrae TaxID=2935737 RepID=A0A931CN46_9MICC|nr:peptidoglycan DD-metalloendopeptidase family protein [Arthrobacter terrae]